MRVLIAVSLAAFAVSSAAHAAPPAGKPGPNSAEGRALRAAYEHPGAGVQGPGPAYPRGCMLREYAKARKQGLPHKEALDKAYDICHPQ